MARSGRHAADDGSFGRSAGGAALRGGALLAIAVILGIILLTAADDNDAFAPVTAGGNGRNGTSATATTRAPANTTTTSSTVPLRPAAEIKVLAANGTTVKGLAGQVHDRLKAAGYNALAPTDASKKPVAKSAVYFTAGYEGEARQIAQQLSIATVAAMPQPLPVLNLQTANVLVVVGTDSPAAATTTTARRGTTATTATTRKSGAGSATTTTTG
jgi:hypothetical protein